jgi:hypothetical protein
MKAHFLATGIKGEGADKARSFIQSWCGQFQLWPARATWQSMHLSKIDQAERIGDLVNASGLNPAERGILTRAIFGMDASGRAVQLD